MNLDAKDALPLYKQLSTIICTEIEKGNYAPGQKIPTENELSTQFNVSRVTVRNALDELTRKQLLKRVRGKGTFIIKNSDISKEDSYTNQPTYKSFSARCLENDSIPGAKVLKCMIEAAGSDDLLRLGLREHANIIVAERIRYADGIPVAMEICHFSEKFGFLLDEELNNASLSQLLQFKHGILLSHATHMIEIAYATYELSIYLQVEQGQPLLLISSTIQDQHSEPVCLSSQYIAADKFRVII